MSNSIEDMLKRINSTNKLNNDKNYRKILDMLQEILLKNDIAGFSAYIDGENLRTSFYFNEEDLIMHGIKPTE